MQRAEEVEVSPEQSEPNKVALTDGSYILWDNKEGYYRVAYFERRNAKSSDLEYALSVAMKRPTHNSRLRKILSYISEAQNAFA